MKVTIAIKKSWDGNAVRGVGTYTRELTGALSRIYSESIFTLTSHVEANSGDLIHYPYFDPFFLSLPRRSRVPIIVTVHDLIPLKYREHFPRGLRGYLKWQIQKRRLRLADHVITDSEASKHDIVNIVGIEEGRVSVVPLAPSPKATSPTARGVVKSHYDLPDRYLLYVGDINWNKNVTGLVTTFRELADPTLHLVLVGKVFGTKPHIPEWLTIHSVIEDPLVRDRIHTMGYVAGDDMAGIYKNALLYVQPSWDEGFGLPILEAMSYGCPVACSNKGSLPEVGGESVAYFDPARDMTKTLAHLIKSSKKRQTLSALGLKHVKSFTWDKTARLTYEIYQKVLG